MTKCNKFQIIFSSLKSKKIVANFKGGAITSDAGSLLIREVDKKLNLTKSISKLIPDDRDPIKIQHTIKDMLRQRIYALALGYEDFNDHNQLRKDLALKIAVEKEDELASPSTLCRFENKFKRKLAVDIHIEMLDQFVKSFKKVPEKLILDFDATDLPIHGKQENRHYHGYYKHDCFLPLHVFCEEKLLVSYLRPSNIDGAKHAWAILSLLIKYFRKIWPDIKIVFRGDSGFCRHKMLRWCEKNKVDYIVGIGANKKLQKLLEPLVCEAKANFDNTKEKQQLFTEFYYKAKTWDKQKRIIGKAEYNGKGENRRFIITTLSESCEEMYKNVYCPRGNMENKIKEQFELFSYRVSCHKWWPNQLRILLSALAYILIENLRSVYFKGTKFFTSQISTIRIKLFKIGDIICKNTRRIMIYISSSYPYQNIFQNLVSKLKAS